MANEETGAPIEDAKSELLKSLELKIVVNTHKIEALKNYWHTWASLIFRVPDETRELNEGAYTPTLVSIGPLHRGKENLQAMEADKLSYMHFLFHRTPNFERTRDDCVTAMLEMECFARSSYSGSCVELGNDNSYARKIEFAEMMLIDACFIIELMYRNFKRSVSGFIGDPILDNHSMMSAVQHDLLRLENQIPFPVLQRLFSLTVHWIPENSEQISLTQCVLSFFGDMMGLGKASIENKSSTFTFHILHLLHDCYLPYEAGISLEVTEEPGFKYSATQLDLAGVKLQAGNKVNLLDVKFSTTEHRSCFRLCRRDCFEIPPFRITYSTEPFLRNLIAFEQFSRVITFRYFTSHAFLMDKLINSAEDVDLLVKAGVIGNYLGSSEEVAHLYNNICKNVYVGDFYFTKPCKQVSDYCEQFWPKCLTKLRRDYFGSPWTGLSVIAAFILFILTLLQTMYTMLSYH